MIYTTISAKFTSPTSDKSMLADVNASGQLIQKLSWKSKVPKTTRKSDSAPDNFQLTCSEVPVEKKSLLGWNFSMEKKM